MRKEGKLISSLPSLSPVNIINKVTGEILTQEDLDINLNNLITWVQNQSKTFYENNKQEVIDACKGYTGSLQPEAFARKKGWGFPVQGLSREVKAKSRIERLARYHLIHTITTYVLNPNLNKQEPGFGLNINLGSVDAQMASLDIAENQLVLTFKCWTVEYEIHFNLPSYLKNRNILKYSLPTIRWDKKHMKWVFNFSILEQIFSRKFNNHSAGLDLGKVKPFTMVITNQSGNRVADYKSTRKLDKLNRKRENLLVERKHILAKLKQYKNLNYAIEKQKILQSEASYKSNKIARLGNTVAWHSANEVTKKLVKHKVAILNLENLKWVVGSKYGSRWNHSVQQSAIDHSLKRQGIKTRKVNPYNTSQECAKCNTKLVHNVKSRTVWCKECKTVLDRDYNAALNISKKQK